MDKELVQSGPKPVTGQPGHPASAKTGLSADNRPRSNAELITRAR